MSDNKNYKLIAIIAILVGAIGVAIGYSAFSSNLNISATAEVSPNNLFSVVFSSSNQSVQTDPIVPSLNPNNTQGFTATNATINNAAEGGPTISNLKATFKEPGETVTYSFNAYNNGEYIAYLNKILFTGSKQCTPGEGTTSGLVTSACNGINMSVTVGENAKEVTASATQDVPTGHSLATSTAEPVVVTITYTSGSAIADGDFTVTFPSVQLQYSSVD